ncbi:PRC-barrel domain-containing protein [Synechococcus sp. MEDNS5]|uniref:PRC-barrel domain-containing protein n=1 Tax=Synechococcus sp. MEDNS5 TaxID=1442554 RepID=UPI0016442853|nr:PRC-barrel domain-containing protein [Synechococcus sp. MEDNS5]QNJ07043.1 PRC-barrel domain-containing protein [Synechococcus sp. MEDNS5]
MSLSSSSNDPLANVPSDRLWLRSELMGTQVITRDTGRRLGVVGEVIVDIDGREVVALGLRDNPLTRFLPGLPRWMPLDRIRQVGDVILVDSADSLSEAFSPERYSRVINCQVITESGQQLGRVLGFSFDIETGELTTLVMGAVGVPLLGEGVLSTWEIPVDEIVSSGADRIIVYEGAEEKLKQLNSGFLEKLGVGGPSWEEQERERYRVNVVPVENQLSSGQSTEDTPRQLEASSSQRFDVDQAELEYVELEQPRQDEARRRRYLDELPFEEDPERYQPRESYPSRDSYQSREVDQDRDFDLQPPRYEEAPPQPRSDQRPRPASRRPIERPGEPLDVEPLDQESQPRSPREPMDDPW